MAGIQSKSLDQPDETRPGDKGKVEVVDLDAGTVMRTTFEPGWRWSECVKPIVGGDSCQVDHFGYCVSGRLHVAMNDGNSERRPQPRRAAQAPAQAMRPEALLDRHPAEATYLSRSAQPLAA